MEIITSLVTVAGQVATLFLMMAVGFVMVKVGWLSDLGLSQMSTLLLYVVTPCIILDSFQSGALPPLSVLGVGVLALFVYYPVCMTIANFLFPKAEEKTRSVLRYGCAYGNTGFMGMPLLAVVLGPEALVYGAISMGLFNIAQWTHGVMVMGSRFSVKKAILNPGVIGVLCALPIVFFHVVLPSPVGSAVSFMADINTPLAMVVIGGQMASADLKATFTNGKLYLVSIIKLLIFPLLMAVLLLPFHLSAILYCTCVVLAATPCAGATAIFAQKFDRDTSSAAQLVTLTTLLSILTLPLFAVLAQTLGG